jgi:6-phosphogluconolactonase
MTTGMSLIERVELCEFPNPEALADSAAQRWLNPSAPDFRHVALSGGRIARRLFAAVAHLAAVDAAAAGKLRNTHFFWADERCVPPADEESNFGLAKALLFDPRGLSSTMVHRLKGELNPDQAVREANAEVVRVAPRDARGLPLFDLVLLGMGEDGHIASLFPGSSTDDELSEAAYAAVVGPKPPNPRITLTYPVLAAAREAWVLISGEGKDQILRNSLDGKVITPLSRLIRDRKRTWVLVDHAFF